MTVPATAAPPARSSQRSGNRPGQSQERARLRVMRYPPAARDAHPPSPEPRADFQPLRDFGLQSWAVGAGEARFCRGDADFIVEVEQSAGFGDREKPCGLVAADAEGMRQAGRQVDEGAGGQLVVLVWSMNAPEYYLLITSRGWTPGQYAGMIRDVWIRTLLRDPPPDKQPSGPIGRLLLLVGSHAECPLWLGRVDRTVLSISARTAAR